jgi:hypothetical protein
MLLLPACFILLRVGMLLLLLACFLLLPVGMLLLHVYMLPPPASIRGGGCRRRCCQH